MTSRMTASSDIVPLRYGAARHGNGSGNGKWHGVGKGGVPMLTAASAMIWYLPIHACAWCSMPLRAMALCVPPVRAAWLALKVLPNDCAVGTRLLIR